MSMTRLSMRSAEEKGGGQMIDEAQVFDGPAAFSLLQYFDLWRLLGGDMPKRLQCRECRHRLPAVANARGIAMGEWRLQHDGGATWQDFIGGAVFEQTVTLTCGQCRQRNVFGVNKPK